MRLAEARARTDQLKCVELRTFFENLGAAIAIIFVDGTADVGHRRVARAEFLAPHAKVIASLVA